MKYLRDSSIPPILYADLFHEIITGLKQASSAMLRSPEWWFHTILSDH